MAATASGGNLSAAKSTTERRRVRVWFGEHVISTHIADPALAQRYAGAMTRRFHGLRITAEDLPANLATRDSELPAEQLWPLTAK